MLQALVLSVAALGAPSADTTFTVAAGAHIVIEHGRGDVDVYGVSGREVRVTIDGESRDLEVSRSGSTYHVAAGRLWEDDEEVVIRVPLDVSVEVHGLEGDVRAFDIERGVSVATIEGDVEIEGTGPVAVQTQDGDVRVVDVRGGVSVQLSDGDSWLENVSGDIRVDGIDGDIVVLDAEAGEVHLQTIDGDLRYDGTVLGGGSYFLSTHDGNVTFAVPAPAGVSIQASAFDGSLESSFDVAYRGGPLRSTELTVGDGSATAVLETFDGNIRLIRPGERAPDNNG